MPDVALEHAVVALKLVSLARLVGQGEVVVRPFEAALEGLALVNGALAGLRWQGLSFSFLAVA
jgi:hypothetical protein